MKRLLAGLVFTAMLFTLSACTVEKPVQPELFPAGPTKAEIAAKKTAVIIRDLQAQGVKVVHQGEQLRLLIPSDRLFIKRSSNFNMTYANKVLPALATLLKVLEAPLVRIYGYTDNEGPPKFNQAVSKRQTEEILYYLSRQGVDVRGPHHGIADAAEDLFTDSLNKADLYSADDLTIIRTRFVDINFDLLAGADGHPKEQPDSAKVLALNLFEDVFFTAVLDRIESNTSGSLAWIGRLKGVEHSQVILVIDDGIMSGNITLPGAFYQVRYGGNGVHAI